MEGEVLVYLVCLLPYFITGSLLRPDLLVTKQSNVFGEDATIYEVNITIHHSQISSNDAFAVQITDELHGMDILSISMIPKLNSHSQYSDSFTPKTIIGVIPHLKLKASVSMVYKAIFLRNKEAIVSSSKATVIWSNGKWDNQSFGPRYSNKTCVKKHLLTKALYNKSYGYIVVGIVSGIAAGCIIAILLIVCLKKYPSAKHYFLHTDEVIGVNNATLSTGLTGRRQMQFYNYAELEEEEVEEEESVEGNILHKLANTFRSQEVNDDKSAIIPPPEMMWRSSLFDGDITAASDGLSKNYIQEYVALLEFTLQIWICVWRSTLATHIDKLFIDGQLNVQRKKKFYDKLTELFKGNYQVNEMESFDSFLDTNTERVLKSFHVGLKFFENMLKDVRQQERKRLLKRTKDPLLLKQAAEDWEKIRQSYMSSLRKDFTTIFGKFLDTLHYIASIFMHVRLLSTTNGLLLVILENSVNLIHNWLKNTMAKYMDMLKRKRLLSDNIDAAFQDVFCKELQQVVSGMLIRKKRTIETDELNSLSTYLQQMKDLNETYSALLVTMSFLSTGSTEDIKATLPIHKIADKFTVCIQYAHSCGNLAQDATMIFARHSHSHLLDGIIHPLNTFILRMKQHVCNICNNETNSNAKLSKYGLSIHQMFNHLSGVLSNLDLKFDEVFCRLAEILNENLGKIEDYGIEFKQFYNGLLLKRKSNILNQINRRQILFKSMIQCHCPLPWEKCVSEIEKAPMFFISALCEQHICPGVFNDYNFSSRVDKTTEKSFLMVISSIRKKFEVINDGILDEIHDTYDEAKGYIHAFTPRNFSAIKKFQKGNYSNLFTRVKKLKQKEYVLNMTCKFVIDILSCMTGDNVENDKELMETLTNFATRLNEITESTDPTVSQEEEEEEEGEKSLKCEISNALKNYASSCKVFTPGTHEIGEELSQFIFNIDEINKNFNAIGTQYKYLEDRFSMETQFITEIWQVINVLWSKSFISKEQIYIYLKDISYLSNEDFGAACQVIFDSNKVNIKDIVSLMMLVMGRKKGKQLWKKLNTLSSVMKSIHGIKMPSFK